MHRTKEYLCGISDFKYEKNFMNVKLSFMPQYHGKSEVDSFFAILSQIYRNYYRTHDLPLKDMTEMVAMLQKELSELPSVADWKVLPFVKEEDCLIKVRT
jgi:hypothetical protein